MPKKKGKKGKGKGNKEGKHESKSDKESDVEKAKASAALWEARLDVTEISRVEYREAARRLARANEELTSQQYRTEKDTLDIVALLNKKDQEKEAKIAALEEQLKVQKAKALQEKELAIAEYMQRINELEERFKKRSNDFSMIQGELKTIREFHKKKALMEQELTDIKNSMRTAERGHRESLARMEHRFFSEKARLEKEAERRITQLAERAHNEAIVQLDEASRSVFKENVRLSEALGYHLKEVQELRRNNEELVEQNTSLTLHKETSELMMKENVTQLAAQRGEISELRAKMASLEQALANTAVEVEREKVAATERSAVSVQGGGAELEKLQRLLETREREMGRVKRLARSIVEQRTQLELFFHEALAQVKEEIVSTQVQHRQQAVEVFRRQMSEARCGRKEFPRIRTFNKPHRSTSDVYSDMEESARWKHLQHSKVDISELTWEQKERVLRLLFAKMNGLKTRRAAQPPALPASFERDQRGNDPGATERETHVTFITQAAVSSMTSELSRLPDLQST